MQRGRIYKAAGLFLMIVGSMVMGIAAGIGLVAYMVKQRLTCVTVAGGENACQDIVGPALDMILASGGGGFAAFTAGLLAIGLVMREEQRPEGGND